MNVYKALIITYYKAPNYGAFLQAYALQQFLKSVNVKSEILVHSANNSTLITKVLDKFEDREVIKYRNKIQSVIDGVQKHLCVSSGKKDLYDIAIIGSDEIWNVKNMTALHLPIFFKPYKRAKKTISYAACAGKCDVKHLRMFPYTVGIRKLDAVSVRDEFTEKTIHKFGIQHVIRTVDPTFLYEFDKEIPQKQVAYDYVLVYTYGLSQAEINHIRSYAKRNKLKIIATGSKCDWADENPLPSPFEWLSLIKYSEAVITSTFHGSVFSIIFNKQFITISNQSNKVKSLLNEMDLASRLITDDCSYEDILERKIDYSHINQIKRIRIEKSMEFILNNL